jgi:8-amino-7-oxononanoate synthase
VPPVDQWARAELSAIAALNLRRTLEPLESAQGPRVRVAGRPLLNFSSNDYLALANSPELITVGQQALAQWGLGAGASRLVVGDLLPHAALERRLAAFSGADRAVVFSSGFAANLGALGSVLAEGDVVFSDALNHASIIDGCRLSRATVAVYRHADLEHLEGLVRTTRGRRRLVVTDAVFSMDGDRAPLQALAQLCATHELGLMVDEAHATGVLGPTGGGLCELTQVRPDLHVGTLSKALGGVGGWVAASAATGELVINRGRSFVFSTGLAPAVCVAAEAALDLLVRDAGRRERLWRNIHHLSAALRELGFEVRPDSAIFSLVLGSESRALAASAALRERGFLVKAIRPPTVPVGTSRLRVSVSAAHELDDLRALVAALGEVLALPALA